MLVVRVLCALLSLAATRGDGGGGAGSAARGEGRVVDTVQGAVRGYRSARGDYYEFHGIPYATVPKGMDKFKAPLPPPIWNSIFEATNDQIRCPQALMGPVDLFGGIQQEDCLIVNVFVPNTTTEIKKSLPVMVYVHGGAFAVGYGAMATHELLIRHGVIVVNFNYRLGIHGFLCLGTKSIPGNAGMKDQVAALKWIRRNIASFGGDPDDVTIAGYSAGSVSVELLMLSPMARGLFNKVISESGSALAPWAVDPEPHAIAKRYVTDKFHKVIEDVIELEEFYLSLTIDDLVSKVYLSEPNSNLGFAPCVEPKTKGQDSFLNEAPFEILINGKYKKVPYMTGFASEEGLFRIDLFDQWKEKMEENFAEFLPQDLIFTNDDVKNSVARKVKSFYFQDQSVSEDTLKQYVDYFTDVMFGYSTIRSARLHVANGVPLYLYEYSYITSDYYPHLHSDKIKGANHGAQIKSLHRISFMQSNVTSKDDVLMEDRLTKMWTDFAKTGVPVKSTSELLPVGWDTMDADTVNYLSMDLEMKSEERLLGDRVKYWDAIYKSYYRTPQSPDSPPLHAEL